MGGAAAKSALQRAFRDDVLGRQPDVSLLRQTRRRALPPKPAELISRS
jgi:hypothetical protein